MRKNNLCEGDWNSTTLNGVQENRTHNDVHEMLTRGGNTLTTDAKGNITVNSNGQRYTWDADNMMSAADISGDLTNDVTYVYDAGNRRIAKIANGITTVFAYAGWRCVEEYDATSTPVALRKFAFGAYLDEPLMMASVSGANETLHFYHQNANFNVIALTDASGTIADRIAYSSYGQIVMVTNGATGNPWFYTGQCHDSDTGLDYYKMRYYDSSLGRFLSRDPIGYEDGTDLYQYVKASPMARCDPTGLITWQVNEPACEITAIVSVKPIWLGDWTDARKTAFQKAMADSIEKVFNAATYKIIPQNKNYKTESCELKQCPCTNGFAPKLIVVFYENTLGTLLAVADWTPSVQANPTGALLRSWTFAGLGGLDEADVNNRPIQDASGATVSNQTPVVHEYGHSIGLNHPGLLKTTKEYTYKGKDILGRNVDGTTDLMGIGMGLQPFYYDKWKDELNSRYTHCFCGCNYETK